MQVRSMFDFLIGSTLDGDLLDDYGALVLKSGTVITKGIVQKLTQHPISHMPKTKPLSYADSVSTALGYLSTLFDGVRSHNRIDMELVQWEIVPRILDVAANPELNELLVMLQAKDKYTVAHSFAVSVMACLLGRWLNLSQETLGQLATAAALHDVGKAKVPENILNKPGALTPDEYEIVKEHTVLGYRLVKSTHGSTEQQALAALQHHERCDGSGYPLGVQMPQISQFARIISIADVFHAMSSNRVYQVAKPMYMVLKEMGYGMYGHFDAAMIQTFLSRMMESLIGSSVVLSDGRHAIIRMIHLTNPTQPLVQTEETFIDLNHDRSLNIVGLPE